MKVLLASQSPRRKELLKELIQDFNVETYPADENFLGETPQDTVREIALRKLNAVPQKDRYDLIIASDTLVYKDGVYYGKPKDRDDAIRMLSELQGKIHQVCSSLAIYYKGVTESHSVTTLVTFKQMTLQDITDYLDSHYCYDKAGAYAVQDGVVVEKYDGSYTNIVGLPIEKLTEILREKNVI
ncbi:MAG: septum formation protein Maf [Clostridia bacterium]|nr:septum formation protein Maf [Clostridia bacterium]